MRKKIIWRKHIDTYKDAVVVLQALASEYFAPNLLWVSDLYLLTECNDIHQSFDYARRDPCPPEILNSLYRYTQQVGEHDLHPHACLSFGPGRLHPRHGWDSLLPDFMHSSRARLFRHEWRSFRSHFVVENFSSRMLFPGKSVKCLRLFHIRFRMLFTTGEHKRRWKR